MTISGRILSVCIRVHLWRVFLPIVFETFPELSFPDPATTRTEAIGPPSEPHGNGDGERKTENDYSHRCTRMRTRPREDFDNTRCRLD